MVPTPNHYVCLYYFHGHACMQKVMTNSWAVHLSSGGDEVADVLARKHGFINLGQVSL